MDEDEVAGVAGELIDPHRYAEYLLLPLVERGDASRRIAVLAECPQPGIAPHERGAELHGSGRPQLGMLSESGRQHAVRSRDHLHPARSGLDVAEQGMQLEAGRRLQRAGVRHGDVTTALPARRRTT